MKILSVSLHNIASIEGPFTLNLEAEPLKSVGLFAITGATGAGKSTILDAICLALYNDTPRLAATQSSVAITDSGVEVKANNVKHLLRKGAVSGYAKVVFQAEVMESPTPLVPVLPATGRFSSDAFEPVPSSTTEVRASVTFAATFSSMARVPSFFAS